MESFHSMMAHIDSNPMEEMCGLIIETVDGLEIIQTTNDALNKEKSFKIPATYLATYSKKIRAVFHSHPGRPSRPSEADIRSSEICGIPYLIVSTSTKEVSRYHPDSCSIVPLLGRHFMYGLYDCLSLVHDYYKLKLMIDLKECVRPRFGWWTEEENYVKNYYLYGFEEVDYSDLLTDDVIVTMEGKAKVPHHFSIYVGGNKVLHHPFNGISSEKQITGSFVSKIERVLRYVG